MRVIGSYSSSTDASSAIQQSHAAGKTHKGHAPKGPPPAPASSSTAGAVTVSLSQKAQELASAQATASASDVDTAKVERLKSAIASGSFQADSSKIASKIAFED